MVLHPYPTRSKAWQAYPPATDPRDSQMGSHCASPPTSTPTSFNEDGQMLSHSVVRPISKSDSIVEGFHMHSPSASLATSKSDPLNGIFHMHSRIAIPRTSNPDNLDEGFHMHSCSAALPNFSPASPDEDTQKDPHNRSRPKSDTASFGDNVYELTHSYFVPTTWSDSLRSHSPVRCPYPSGHWPYMAPTYNRYLPYSGRNLHLLEPTETAEEHTKTPDGLGHDDNLDQASMTSDDQTIVEVWGPSSREIPMCNAKEDPIPWAEWTDSPPWLENSPSQTPLKALPPIVLYRISGSLHLNIERVQEHSASMSRQRPKQRLGARRFDPQNLTSMANQRPGSKPRPLNLKEALSLVRSTKAQNQAPESIFALRASSENPFMGHDISYLDDGFTEFAKSSLDNKLEVPDHYGAAFSRPEPASSIDVFKHATWQVSTHKLRAFSPSMHPLTLEQEIRSIAYELKIKREWTYVLCSRVLIHLVRGRYVSVIIITNSPCALTLASA